MEKEKCPCCLNHCEKDSLSCGKGVDYFSNPKSLEKPETIEEEVIRDLRKCGHLLHHNPNLNTNDLLNDCSKEELEQLHTLLAKIYSKVE